MELSIVPVTMQVWRLADLSTSPMVYVLDLS